MNSRKPTLCARTACCDITPLKPVPLAGFARRKGSYTQVADSLEVNALALSDGDCEIFILTGDLLYFGGYLRSGILAGMSPVLTDETLFLAASHTHFAPATTPRLALMGAVDEEYLEWAVERIVLMLRNLLRIAPREVTLFARTGCASHSVNRRRPAYRWSGVAKAFRTETELAPNLRGPRDETLRLIEVRERSGSVVAVLWNYCCHPVFYPEITSVSAEFPGVVRAALREELGARTPVLFLQGFAGNVRPRAILWPRTLRGRVRGLLNRHYWMQWEMPQWEAWATSLAAAVLETHRAGKPIAGMGAPIRTQRISFDLDQIHQTDAAAPSRSVVIHALRLGELATIVGVSAEPVVEYVADLQRQFSGDLVIPVGCIDDVFGYLSKAKMLSQGGYEVSGFQRPFGLTGTFRGEVEKRFCNALRAVAKQLGTQ